MFYSYLFEIKCVKKQYLVATNHNADIYKDEIDGTSTEIVAIGHVTVYDNK